MVCAGELVAAVESAVRGWSGVSDALASHRPGIGKWSAKEILGHLIDSAANNHPRFVRARFTHDLVFPGYDQDGWVEAQRYNEAAWHDLLGLWAAYNRRLAAVMRATPEAVRLESRERHNLDAIAFRTVPADRPATLEYLMCDYVEHLKHHVSQIVHLVGVPDHRVSALAGDEPRSTRAGDIVIRPATLDDQDAVWDIFHAVVSAGDTYAYSPATTRAEAMSLWFPPHGFTFVAERDGGAVGTYLMKANQAGLGDHVANCGYMVAPDASGAGVGAAMCRHSLEFARERGFTGMQFNAVVSTNVRAVALWQRMGFAIVGTVPNAFRHATLGPVAIHVMYRDL